MSIKAIGIVLDASINPPTNKLTAVVLADWCNDEGGSLFPSMSKIAAKVGVSRSQAQRIVHGFVDQGLLSVVANGAGGKPGVTPRYQMHLDRIAKLVKTGSTHATGRAGATGRIHAQDGSHGCGETGSTHATQTVNGTVSEPPTSLSRPAATKIPVCPYNQIVESYHAALPELPRVKLLDAEGRPEAARKFWQWIFTSKKSDGTQRATTADEALAWIGTYFTRARENDFLMGRTTRSDGHQTWRCDFDFLLTKKGKKHVIEKTEAAA